MKHALRVFVVFFGVAVCGRAQDSVQVVSLCTLSQNPEQFLNVDVEIDARLFIGTHSSYLREEECMFGIAFGDDYQTFGNRFAVKHDAQWNLMKKILGTSACKIVNVRVATAHFRGTVVRAPATGTIPEDEMAPELIIRSVSDVSRVPVKCPALISPAD